MTDPALLRQLVQKETDLLNQKKHVLSEIKNVRQEISILTRNEAEHALREKDFGEKTIKFPDAGASLLFEKKKRVRYNAQLMQKAASTHGLSWEDVNRFFNVKFEMKEAQYNELCAAALDSDRYSDILSDVDEAREVDITGVTLKSCKLED